MRAIKGLVLSFALLTGTAASAVTLDPFSLPWKNHPTRDTRYTTADHPSAVFVLEFLANFCGACNENAPNVKELATAYKNDARVQVLDMSIDRDEREIAAWIRRHQPEHPVLKDENRVVWGQVGAEFIPTVVIANCRGEEIFRHTDVWTDEIKQEIHRVIDAQLAQGCTLD